MTKLGVGRIICLLFFCLFGWTFLNVALTTTENCLVSIAVAVALLLLVLALRWVLQRCLFHVTQGLLYGLFAFLLVGLTVLQLFVGWKLMAQPDGTLAVLHNGALQWCQQGSVDTSTLNLLTTGQRIWLVVLARIYQWIQGWMGRVPLFAGVCLNTLAVDLSACLLFFICKRLWNLKIALLAGIVSAVFLPYYLTSTVFSLDLAVMPLVLGAVALLTCRKTGNTPWSHGQCFAGGWLLGIAVCLKGSGLVVLAVLICYLGLHRREGRSIGLCLAGAFLSMVLLVWMTQGMLYSRETPLGDKDPPLGIYLLAGLQEDGLENETVSNILELPTQQEQSQAAEIAIRERLEELGGTGLIRYWTEKSVRLWGDGTYSHQESRGEMIYPGLLPQFVMANGIYYPAVEYLCQGMQIAMLFLMWVSLAWGVRRPSWNLLGSLRVGLAGIFLFSILGPSQARDLLTYVPLFFLLALDGLNVLCRISWGRLGRTLCTGEGEWLQPRKP